MTEVRTLAGQMLETVRCGLPELQNCDCGRIETAQVLVSLANTWPGPLGERDRRNLETLCRKIAVATRVLEYYGPDWSKPDKQQPLPAAWWPMLIAVLLAYRHAGEPHDENERGLAFKSLNAALAVLDMADSIPSMANRTELRSWADEILGQLYCEGRR